MSKRPTTASTTAMANNSASHRSPRIAMINLGSGIG
jgi:hypothetical protein